MTRPEDFTHLEVTLDLEGAWPDLAGALKADWLAIGRLPRGMTSGASSVVVKLCLEDGRIVWAETSLRVLELAVEAFKAADDEAELDVTPQTAIDPSPIDEAIDKIEGTGPDPEEE